jgi:2-phospho-L-lactate/phosphoenolpyruvate guanylyltransferase
MSKPDVWAVVPVKEFQHSKTRLSDILHDRQRRFLCDAMLRDVLTTLSRCTGLAGVLVVTRDADAINVAQEFGARIVYCPIENGVSAAIIMAAGLLADEGCSAMLAIMGDLPLIKRKEIDHLLAIHTSSPAATLVPSRNGAGTNAALCSPPNLVPFRFDGRSLLHNRTIAARIGATVRVEHLDGLGLDIDTAEDLALFVEQHSSTKTAAFLGAEKCTEPSYRRPSTVLIQEALP